MRTNKGSTTYAQDVDRLLTDREAAKYLGLKGEFSYVTVQRLVRSGKLRGGKVGDLHRFRKRDLDDYVFSTK